MHRQMLHKVHKQMPRRVHSSVLRRMHSDMLRRVHNVHLSLLTHPGLVHRQMMSTWLMSKQQQTRLPSKMQRSVPFLRGMTHGDGLLWAYGERARPACLDGIAATDPMLETAIKQPILAKQANPSPKRSIGQGLTRAESKEHAQ